MVRTNMRSVNCFCCCKNKEESSEQQYITSNVSDKETEDDDQHSSVVSFRDNSVTYGATSQTTAPIEKISSDKEKPARRRRFWKRNDEKKQTVQSLKYGKECPKAEIKGLQKRLEEEQEKTQALTYEREVLKHELEELRTRLSAVISAQVTDSNPNIADLSDQNRPTKLTERYSELYDNQWTECYEGLTKNLTWKDKDSITWILNLFLNIFVTCEEKASKDLDQLREMLNEFQSGTTETLKRLKDNRKKSSMIPKDHIRAKLDSRFNENKQAIKIAETFINESVELCWLMAVQDPPVHVDSNVNKNGQPLDPNNYKYYTQKGKLVDYVVWPVLFLTIDGPLLSKGIAQGLVEERQSEESQTKIEDCGKDTPSECTKL